jgi:heptosyltransferase III
MIFPFTITPDVQSIQKVLIVRQDRLGDLILTLPLATWLKKHKPELIVDMLVPQYSAPIAEACPDIDTVHHLPANLKEANAYAEMLNILRASGYDLCIVPNTKSIIAKLIYDAHIPYRVGQGLRWHGWRYNLPVFQKRKMPVMHELDYNFQLLNRWLPSPSQQEVQFNIQVSDTAVQKVKQLLASHSIKDYSIIHPGSGGSAIDISPELLGKLAASGTLSDKVIVTGSANEAHLAEQLVEASGHKVLNLCGALSLHELMALIQHCTIFIGNSTGPLHIARALGRPVLGFYSTFPACHPMRWGPYAKTKSQVLLPPNEFYSGFEPDKAKSALNMKQIELNTIIQKLKGILGQEV